MPVNLAAYRTAVARATKNGDAEAVTDARRDLAAAKLEVHIRDLVDSAPPLTAEQRERLAALLKPAS